MDLTARCSRAALSPTSAIARSRAAISPPAASPASSIARRVSCPIRSSPRPTIWPASAGSSLLPAVATNHADAATATALRFNCVGSICHRSSSLEWM